MQFEEFEVSCEYTKLTVEFVSHKLHDLMRVWLTILSQINNFCGGFKKTTSTGGGEGEGCKTVNKIFHDIDRVVQPHTCMAEEEKIRQDKEGLTTEFCRTLTETEEQRMEIIKQKAEFDPEEKNLQPVSTPESLL